jgi:hypothetical protein
MRSQKRAYTDDIAVEAPPSQIGGESEILEDWKQFSFRLQ